MRLLARSLIAPALAAALIVAFEIARTLVMGNTHLGSFGQIIGFATAVIGLLGLPLWLAGTLALLAFDVGRVGWRWGRGEAPPPAPARVVAWLCFGGVALAAVVFGTQAATMRFVRAFNQPVYQGLGAGLVAAGIVVGAAVLSGPVVGGLARAIAAVSRRLPRPLDPTTPRGAVLWLGLALFFGAALAPVVVPALHTVDLRLPRLGLAWAVMLAVAVWWVGRRPRRWPVFAAAGLAVALFVTGLLWSAAALGHSQRRLLALDRDTLAAGRVARRLSRLGDRDGDGVPQSFAGGDCDDSNPAIRPGVYDAPSDGVDQNCTGADLDLRADPIKAPPRVPPAGEPQPWNVVLVTIDALRADVVPRLMPRLSALAAESLDYRNAYSHGAATYWSIPALLCSTLPSRLHMGGDQTPVNEEVLLTEVLRDAGWHTALFANVTVFFVRGLRQGALVADYETSHYTVHGAKPGSAHMTSGMLAHVDRWMKGGLRPQRDRFSLWGHYYDPHDPYFEVEGYPAEEDSDHGRYEAIVRYVDTEVGRLIDGLKERGLWERTLFIVTADHGDEFGDHGNRFHGRTLYEEMVHVPLIVRVPGLQPQVIETPIGHDEVAPTLLDLLGLPTPRTWLGRSRVEEARTGQPAAVEPVFFEVFPDSNYESHQVGVRLGALKLIHRLDTNSFELYDLSADPGERDNVYDVHPEAPALRARLLTYLDHHLYHLAQGRTGARKPPGSPDKPARPPKPRRRPGK